jgi:hypothetical protein
MFCIGGLDSFSELEVLKNVEEINTPIETLNYVVVTSAETSFSKLK